MTAGRRRVTIIEHAPPKSIQSLIHLKSSHCHHHRHLVITCEKKKKRKPTPTREAKTPHPSFIIIQQRPSNSNATRSSAVAVATPSDAPASTAGWLTIWSSCKQLRITSADVLIAAWLVGGTRGSTPKSICNNTVANCSRTPLLSPPLCWSSAVLVELVVVKRAVLLLSKWGWMIGWERLGWASCVRQA